MYLFSSPRLLKIRCWFWVNSEPCGLYMSHGSQRSLDGRGCPTQAVLVFLHLDCDPSCQTKQGGAEPKLRLARSEAAFQKKSSFLSANQSEVQEPGRLPGQHG